MEFKDLLLDNKLEIGKEAYLDFVFGTYLGLDEGGYHQLEYERNGEKKIKATKYIPTVPQLPLNIYVKNKRTGEFGEIISYKNFNDKMYYIVKEYSDVFRDDSRETIHDLIKNYEAMEGSPFKESDEIDSLVVEIDSELAELEKRVNELKSNRKDITKYCKHEWYKYEPEEISHKNFEQRCRCELCGEEKINRFSSWF